MTEDMLWEQAAVLAKLGTSEEAARVRAKMQSTSLLSDMQAFKVNVQCTNDLATVAMMSSAYKIQVMGARISDA